jgi:hypothetical protein
MLLLVSINFLEHIDASNIIFFWVVPRRVNIPTPGNYPKEDNIRFSQHGESLKTRYIDACFNSVQVPK